MRWTGACLLGMSLLLAGCGFAPLNARHGDDSTVADLSSVKIGPVVEGNNKGNFTPNARYDQEFRNRLLNNFNPDGQPTEPAFELRVLLTQTSTEIGTQPDGSSARTDVSVEAHYELIKLATGKPVVSGNSYGINSYPIITNSYATLVGGQDAQRRAVESVADDIARRVSLYFHGRTDQDQ